MPGAQETPFTPDQWASFSSLPGSSIPSGASVVVLDPTDPSMGPSGTLKRSTLADLQVGLTNIAGLQKGLEESVRGSTGSLASTFDRGTYVDGTRALTSGRIECYRVALSQGMPISKIRFWSGIAGSMSGITHFWMGLFDKSLNRLGVTNDDVTATLGASTLKELTIAAGPIIVPRSDIYYVGVCLVASGLGNFAAQTASNSNIRLATPVPGFAGNTGLTDPASCPSQLTNNGVGATMVYGEVA